MKVRGRRPRRMDRFRSGRAAARARRDPGRPRVLGSGGRRRRRRVGLPRAPRRRVHVPDRARRRSVRPGIGRGARGARRLDGRRLARRSPAPRVLLPRGRRRADDHDTHRQAPSAPRRAACLGRAGRRSTACTSRAATPTRSAPPGPPACSWRRRGSSRRSARRGWSSTRSSAAPPIPTRPTTGRSSRRPALVVVTEGAAGGRLEPGGRYEAAPLPAALADSYGAGDAFAAGLTFALAEGRSPADAAAFAATQAAEQLTRRGAY